jgi:uncharacterized membrane protein
MAPSRLTLAALISAAAAAPTLAQSLTILSFGVRPVSIRAISGDGSIIAGEVLLPTTSGDSVTATWWSRSGAVLGQAPTSIGQSFPTALTFDGSTLLFNSGAPALPRLLSTSTGTITSIPGANPATQTFANDISANGARSAMYFDPTGFGPSVGLSCDNSQGHTAPTSFILPNTSNATRMSADGNTIIGQLSDFTGFRYTPGAGVRSLCSVAFGAACPSATPQDPGTLIPQGISANGNTIVGGTYNSTFQTASAFRLDDADGFELIVNCSTNTSGSATAVDASANGSVIVGYDTCSLFNPWVWTRATGPRSLTQILNDAGISTTNYFFDSLVAISDDGRYITGNVNIQFVGSRGFIVDLGPALPSCDSIDFNSDSLFPDDQDLVDLLSVLAGGACSTNTCNDIDFNNDTLFPDDSDLIAFLRVLAGGEC